MALPITEQLMQRAVQEHQAGRLVEAEAVYRQVLEQRPNHAGALHLLGVIHHQRGEDSTARQLISRAIAADARPAEFHLNLGNANRALGKFAEALENFDQAIARDSRLPQGHFNRAAVLRQLGRLEESITSCNRALELQPVYPKALVLLADSQIAMREFDAGIANYRLAISKDHRCLIAYTGLSDAYRRKGDLQQARTWCEAAMQLDAAAVEPHVVLAPLLLLAEDFAAGWKEYEWRLKLPETINNLRKFGPVRWDGSDLNGRTLLLWGEQGLGDTLQFVRFAGLAASRGGRVIVECPAAICSLVQTVAGVSAVVAAGQPLPAFDVYCPLLSLPLMLNMGGATAADLIPYLQVDQSAVQRWCGELHCELPGKRIGIAWAGNPGHLNDRNRSMRLIEMLPLLRTRGARFFSLQVGAAVSQLAELPADVSATDLSPQLHTMSETAAVIANLDLVIGVDTSVIHLAGALGKPVWGMIPFAPEWRWGLNRSDTPWYPTMRLFRQKAPGDWSEPVSEAASKLENLA